MVKVLLIMHHNILCTPCFVFMLVSHTCVIAVGHVEVGHEEPPEPFFSGAMALSITVDDRAKGCYMWTT
jgi:hypothetical protein